VCVCVVKVCIHKKLKAKEFSFLKYMFVNRPVYYRVGIKNVRISMKQWNMLRLLFVFVHPIK
jgi:hypothetical protein